MSPRPQFGLSDIWPEDEDEALDGLITLDPTTITAEPTMEIGDLEFPGMGSVARTLEYTPTGDAAAGGAADTLEYNPAGAPADMDSVMVPLGSGPSRMEIGELQMGPPEDGGMQIGEITSPDDEALAALAAPEAPPAAPPPQGTSTYAKDVIGPSGLPFNVSDTRQDLRGNVARVRQLFAGMPPQAPQDARFEGEFLSQNRRPTDDDFRRAWIMGLFDKERGAALMRHYEQQQARFDEGLAAARTSDRSEYDRTRRVDPATAELLVLAGMSPESAAEVRMGDPSVQLARSLGALGLRLRGQDQAFDQGNVKTVAGVQGQQSAQNFKADQNALQRQNNIDVAQAHKKAGGGGGGMGNPAALDDEIANTLANAYQMPVEAIRTIMAGGEVPGVAPELQSRIQSSAANYRNMGGEKLDQLQRGIEATTSGEYRKPMVVAAVKSADPIARAKYATQYLRIGRPLDAAFRGWRGLTAAEKALVVKLGPSPAAAVLEKMLLSGGAQAKAAAVWRHVNEAVHEISGANVTEVESPRLAKGYGLALSGVGNLLQSPQVMEDWLNETTAGYRDEFQIWDRTLGIGSLMRAAQGGQ